ncbi:hypothetical protein BGZ60DRAFT_428718 [Tricladium varicosporioides]|nr:hypothetical protein BGZ60DRAFT_428718 [Hymenoscyphus varicosporioides]
MSSPSNPTSSKIPDHPIPVPTHGPGGTFTVLARTTIFAPPVQVLSLIRNTSTWKEWNSFCPACTIHPSKGKSKVPILKGTNFIGEEKEFNFSSEGKVEEEGWLEGGTVAVIDVFMNGDGLVSGTKRSRTQGVEITSLEKLVEGVEGCGEKRWDSEYSRGRKGFRIAWKSSGWSHWQLHSERVMEFLEKGSDGMETEYFCWETFGGMLGPVVKRTVGHTLVDRFGDYAADVKKFLEGKQHQEDDEEEPEA